MCRKASDLKQISGIYAAALTPRLADNSFDAKSMQQLVSFLLSKNITSYALNGATGEFCLTSPDQLGEIIAVVQEASEGKADILCGVGAPGTSLAVQLAEVAQKKGVKSLLLPMPYYFPYQQEDLALFCKDVAASTDLPILLYNLPQFASGLEKETVRELITTVPNIIGIKDSSGSLEILRDLTKHGVDACRIVGNDNALAGALSEGVCDGVVSGVACALPEAIQELYALGDQTKGKEFSHATKVLSEFIVQLDKFPTPWGLKFMVEARGVLPATFAQPVTEGRLAEGKKVAAWLREWYLAKWGTSAEWADTPVYR